MSIIKLFLLSIISFSQFTLADHITPTAIYDKDDRIEFYASKNPLVKEAEQSIAAMISNHRINSEGRLSGPPYKNKVCSNVRFYNQTSIAKCTGFLVSSRHIVTAGHCIKTKDYCQKFKWVFGLTKKSQSHNTFNILSKDIYHCKKIVERKFSGFGAIDHAVIELDRDVLDRKPLSFRRTDILSNDDHIILMGYPSGLPLKIVENGNIIKNDHPQFFESDLDTFGGNSGSPILNGRTGLVEGIQTRGHAGHVRHPNKACKILKVCKQGECNTAKGTRIMNIEFLKSL